MEFVEDVPLLLYRYGVNTYTWCSRSATVDTSSTSVECLSPLTLKPACRRMERPSPNRYGIFAREYDNVNVPMIFSEFGCNTGDFHSVYPNWDHQRTWTQAGFAGYLLTHRSFAGVLPPYSHKLCGVLLPYSHKTTLT